MSDLSSLSWEAILTAPSILDIIGEATGALRISTDTREDLENAIFVPLKGETFDGENFMRQAYDAGARVFAYTRNSSLNELRDHAEESAVYIKVKDGLSFLLDLANIARNEHSFEVIGVTGSVGKTSCRNWIMAGLGQTMTVSGTKANLNNPIGVSQSIFALDSEARVAVLELAMDHAGEISLSSIAAEPDRAVITNIGTSHLAHFDNREDLLQAKLEILEGMSDDAPLHLRWDEDLLSQWVLEHEDQWHRIRLYAGRNYDVEQLPALPICLAYYESSNLVFKFYRDRALMKEIKLETREVEPHHLAHLAVTAQIMAELDIEVEASVLRSTLSTYRNEPGRLARHQIGSYLIIDDAYNASPESMEAAFESLQYHGVTEAVACIASVNELGPAASFFHERIGEALTESGVFRLVFLLGPHSDDIHRGIQKIQESYPDSMEVILCEGLDDMFEALRTRLKEGDTILLKGSNSYRLGTLRAMFEEAVHD